MIEKAAEVSTYGGAATALIFGLTAGEWQVVGVISGILIGLVGLAITSYFKHKHLQLARERKVIGYGEGE